MIDSARKKELKRLVKEQELRLFKDVMPISLTTANELLDFIDKKVAEIGCDHSHKQTEEFCRMNGLDSDAVVSWANENGGHCDCEVLFNLEDGLEAVGKLKE
jgi:Protein of unknown function (DUF2695)